MINPYSGTRHAYRVELTHWNRRVEWANRLKLVFIALFCKELNFSGDVE